MTGAIRQMRPLTGTKGGLCSGVIGGGISPTSIVRACTQQQATMYSTRLVCEKVN